MKKLLFILMAVTVLALNLKTAMAGSWMNKGSTAITMLAFNVEPSTSVDMNMIEGTTVEVEQICSGTSVSQAVEAKANGRIEQGVMKELSSHSTVIMNITQMQAIENTAQWRNNYLNSSLGVNMAMMDLVTAVPSIWLITGVELSLCAHSANGFMTNRTAGVPSIGLMNENVSIMADEITLQEMLTIQKVWPAISFNSNFAGETISVVDNAMQNSLENNSTLTN